MAIVRAVSQKKFENVTMLGASCVVSFVVTTIVGLGFEKIGISQSLWTTCVACIVLSVVSGIVAGVVIETGWFKAILLHCFGITLSDGTISGKVNWKNGSNVELYLKDADYYILGHVRTVGDGEGDGMICVSEPIWYDKNDNIIESCDGEQKTYCIVSLSDVEYIKLTS